MKLLPRHAILWSVLVLCGAGLLPAQESDDSRLNPDDLRAMREQTAADSAADPALREARVALLDEALLALDAAATDQAIAAGLRREAAGVDSLRASLEAELNRPQTVPPVPLGPDATIDQAEAALARERAHLGASRGELRRAEGMAEERARRRNEIAARLGSLDQQEVLVDDQLRRGQMGQERPGVAGEDRLRLLARRQAIKADSEKLRAEMELLEARGSIIPLQVDLAQRRVAMGERLVPLIEERTQSLRRSEARASLEQVRKQVAEVMLMTPVLAEVAAETVAMAEEVWGEDGVTARSDETARRIAATRKVQADLDRIVDLAWRRFLAFGSTGSIQRWWPDIPEDFPAPDELAQALERLDQSLPEVQHQLIALEQQRSGARLIESRLMELLTAGSGGDPQSAALEAARRLLETRRELLDALIRVNSRYVDRLLELKTVGTYFLEDFLEVERFLYEHLLWSRSVPRPILPQPVAMLDALGWLASWASWQEAAGFALHRVRLHPVRLLLMLLAFAILLGLRRRIRQRMERLGRGIEEGKKDTLRRTLEALFHTAFLAAPLPAALYTAHYVLLHGSDSTFLLSAAQALFYITSLAALMELGRQTLMPRGLGESHFGWPARVTRRLYKELVWPEMAFLVLMQPALHLAMAGIRLRSANDLQAHNNSLGRVLFMLAMTMLGMWLLGIFRGRRAPGADMPGGRSPVWDRLYIYAYPLIVLVTLVPVLLAAFGYYITAILMAYQILRTLWLALILLLVGGLIFRWIRLGQSREPAQAGQPSAEVADAQVRSLFRFILLAAMAVGLWIVWADALPTLQMLKRVQIWPSISLLEAAEEKDLPALTAQAATPESAPAAPASGKTATPQKIPGMPVPAAATGEAAAAEPPLTLWAILQAMLVILITVQVVRNLPGLLQLTLQRRSLLDSGARIALGTLVRYAAIIIGVSIAFGLLGISWSRIQWLAAALTFGLGFGLQEIVANFVSGLILLTERPVRVGDAVTVGNLQGRVTRIQIRATTITLWDQSEMIVPNKEFVTTKLINWTLTDSRRRIDLPLRVAYGSDLPLVKKVLLEVAAANRDIPGDPPSQALVLDFGDEAIKMELRCFVDFGMGLKVQDDLHMAIDRAFREHGIEFALPRLDLQVRRRAALPPAPGDPSPA